MNRVELLIVDGNGVAWEIATGRRATGFKTGVLVQLTRTMLDRLEENPSFIPILIFDSGRSEMREQIFPGYKAHRELTPDRLDALEQIREAQRALTMLGRPFIAVEKVEADDIICILTTIAAAKSIPVTIMSKDSDLWQVGFPGVRFYRNGGYHEARELLAEWQGSPSRYVLWKALCGDKSDNIPGVRGIGPKAAHMLVSLSGGDMATMFSGRVRRILEGTKGADGRVARSAIRIFEKDSQRDLNVSYRLVRTAKDVRDLGAHGEKTQSEINRVLNMRRQPVELTEQRWLDFLREYDAFGLVAERSRLEHLYGFRIVS